MRVAVRGVVITGGGGHGRAVLVEDGEDWGRFLRREGVTSIPVTEEDVGGHQRPSLSVAKWLAGVVRAGDLVELVVNARATDRGSDSRSGRTASSGP